MRPYENILQDELFLENLHIIEEQEKDRIYCKHGLEHLIDVCRIGYIIILENNYKIEKDWIYAAGLLHDIGRAWEYTKGVGHHEAGAEIARTILPRCGYTEGEISIIEEAIISHRNQGSYSQLGKVLYEADKRSRNCFACKAWDTCKWNDNTKNRSMY